jgi:hypothetical protein
MKIFFMVSLFLAGLSANAVAASTILSKGKYLLTFERPTEGCAEEHDSVKTHVLGETIPKIKYDFGGSVRCEGPCPWACIQGNDWMTVYVELLDRTAILKDSKTKLTRIVRIK